MESDRHFELDARESAWAEDADAVLKSVLGGAASSVTVLAEGAPAPSARAAQFLLLLKRHVEGLGGSFSVLTPSQTFRDGLGVLGLQDLILSQEVAQQ